MVKPFVVESSEVLIETPIFKIRKDKSRHPDREKASGFVVLENPDWVNVIAETPEGKILLIRQYRHGTQQIELEIPGGMVDEGEDALTAAARELREETGYEAEHLEVMGTIRPNPAFQDNTCTAVLAKGCRKLHDVDFDENEEVDQLLVSPDELETMVKDGRMAHGVVLVSVLRWLLYHRRQSKES